MRGKTAAQRGMAGSAHSAGAAGLHWRSARLAPDAGRLARKAKIGAAEPEEVTEPRRI
jgi:hypothetical protein